MRTLFERFLKKNLDLKIVSLILAALLWLFIHLTQTAGGIEQSQTRVRIPLVIENLAPRLHVLSAPADVTVTVRTVRKSIERAKPSDFKASIDLEGKVPGAFVSLPVHIASPVGYVVTDVSPPKVDVALDEEKEKTVPVTWEFDGGTESKLLVTPREVVVKGSKTNVSRVVAAEIHIPDATPSSPSVQEFKPTPVDILSRPVPGPEVIPESVRIIRQETIPIRPMAIRPDLVGKLAKDLELQAVSVNPPVIMVELLSGHRELDHLDTEPVDMSQLHAPAILKVKLVVPAGLKVHGDNEVTVMILLGKRT